MSLVAAEPCFRDVVCVRDDDRFILMLTVHLGVGD